jgi:hypothetical protein
MARTPEGVAGAEVREVNVRVARGDMDDCRLRKFFGLREIEPSPWIRWL